MWRLVWLKLFSISVTISSYSIIISWQNIDQNFHFWTETTLERYAHLQYHFYKRYIIFFVICTAFFSSCIKNTSNDKDIPCFPPPLLLNTLKILNLKWTNLPFRIWIYIICFILKCRRFKSCYWRTLRIFIPI